MKGRFLRPFIWSALPFAAVMVVVELVLAGSALPDALVTAAISGGLFGGAMGALNASTWLRDWARSRTDFSFADGESVQQSGFATRGDHRGVLCLTNQRLRFTSHSFSRGTGTWSVSLGDIEQAVPTRTVGGVVPNGIRLEMASGANEMLTTWERDEWCKAINARV